MKNLVAVILLCFSLCSYADPPIIAVASNLTAPITEIVRQYQAETGIEFRLTLGSSGNLARKIVQGAPYELFISAGAEYIEFLFDQGVISINGWEFASGPVGIFVPADSTLYANANLQSIIMALRYQSYRKIALANPEHAPYGKAAIEALQSGGVWTMEKSRTLLAENVAQVMTFALSGNTDLAIIPYSFMKQDNMQDRGVFLAFPDDWYTPVMQYVVLLQNASPATQDFERFLASDKVRQILDDYGYATPELQ